MNNFSARIRSRKLWDKHGSWLILVVVVGLAWNGGAEWRDYKHRQVVAVVVTAGVAERDSLRARLRQVHEEKQRLVETCTPAVEKASEAVDKVNKLIEREETK